MMLAKRAIIILVLFAAACGGQYGDYLQSAIDAKRAACAAREWVIIQRDGSTLAQAEADVAKVRAECDVALKVLERLALEQN